MEGNSQADSIWSDLFNRESGNLGIAIHHLRINVLFHSSTKARKSEMDFRGTAKTRDGTRTS